MQANCFTAPVACFVNGIGDHFMALPAIRALAQMFPDQLTLICSPRVQSAIYEGIRFKNVVETRITYEGPSHAQTFDAQSIARRIGFCDLFVSLNPWHTSSVNELLAFLRPSMSIGFFDAFSRVADLNFSKHSADLSFDIPLQLNPRLNFTEYAAPPLLTSAASDFAKKILVLAAGRSIVALHADTKAEKMWSPVLFRKVINEFLEQHDDALVLLIGWDTFALDEVPHGDRVVQCCRLPLQVTIALVSISQMFCGVDSSMLHAADFFRIPSVGLFGATDPNEFGFRLAPHQHVTGTSMADITTTQVLDAMNSMWLRRT